MISDEIHAPLVLPGAEHVPYLRLEGTADHAVAVVAASKAFNTAGLSAPRSSPATTRPAPAARRADGPQRLLVVARRGGRVAAYTHGDPWLAALRERLDGQRTLLGELLAEHSRRPGCDRSRRRTSPGWTSRLRPRRPGRRSLLERGG